MSGSTKLLSMIAAIARGETKANSHLVENAADGKQWDKLAADHARLLKDHPGAFVEIPNEF